MPASMQRSVWLAGGAAILVVLGGVALWWRPMTDSASNPAATTAPATSAPSAAQNPPPGSPATPSFDIVKVGPNGNAVIAGRAAPGAQVSILDGDKKLGEVTADGRGEWVLIGKEPLRSGDRQLRLESVDPQSGAKAASPDTVAVAVAPAKSNEKSLAVLLPADADKAAKLLQSPAAGAAGAELSLDSAEVVGGDLAGAVVQALGVKSLRIGAQIDPGVPATQSIGEEPLALALKSGNFGTKDFFVKALKSLDGAA